MNKLEKKQKIDKEIEKFIKKYNVKDSKEKVLYILGACGFYIQTKPTMAYIDLSFFEEKGLL
ncbi:hypothetical protein L2Z99_00610 [Lactobacillus mulieris]|jgi:hypothetical protein|uniref:Uncharacterized protein n=2 Tax=root TaxID=1 RepID=A0AAW5WWF6_9LACO|nr:hypothetical protein [Lactobacillus mulieris]KAA9369862.1 hypothetical protein F6I25_00960 [Lactobacillus jensenii]DAD80363.1 MAG TPA: hypothetical protein [Siphoviridae sp. ctX581]MCF1847348.1 hypothetical protein [Lactobacillus mulieris]MCW8106854.1 hypothetical protein [Lactobacillus mulieris]MCZ9647149.1 hypothetical protein [Lactobacillus mulieris]